MVFLIKRFGYCMVNTASTLHELFGWWDSTNGGKDDDSYVRIKDNAVIANCSFIDSLERVSFGNYCELGDLIGLSSVNAAAMGVHCKLRGLVNVEVINWDCLAVGVRLYDLKKFDDFEAGKTPKAAGFYGLKSVTSFRHFEIGVKSSYMGLCKLEMFDDVTFGKRSAFKGLSGLSLNPLGFITESTPADNVLFRFTKPATLVASTFKGFNGVCFYSKKGCVVAFDEHFPENTHFDFLPSPDSIEGPVRLSKGMGFNCDGINDVDSIKHLWAAGVAVPEQIKLYGFGGSIRDIPEMLWGRVLAMQAI